MTKSEGPMVAESKTSKKPPKVLDHIRVSRSLEGGHVMEHHYTSYAHEPRPFKFGPEEGGRAAKHLLKHAGLPVPTSQAETEAETETEEEEPEVRA
jgi:hypothetical protein